MGLVGRMALFWQCENCGAEWYAATDQGPRQCPSCGSRRWNNGEVAQADLYARARRIVHLNPYRKPLSFKQKASLSRRKAAGRAAVASHMAQTAL
jgi:predicted  nucleic acid-binding Zn-ribbon protein